MSLLHRVHRAFWATLRNRVVILAVMMAASVLIFGHGRALALPPSPDKVPNGAVFSCGTCHLQVGAGYDYAFNTQMKLDFLNTDPSKTWTATLANKDSDGDGFTNGEELQDPEGTWVMGQPNPGSALYVTNPSVAASAPIGPVIQEIGNFFGTTASGEVSFFIIMEHAPIGLSRVEYTVHDHQGDVVFQSTATVDAPPFRFLSAGWDTTQAPDGQYTVTAVAFEQRRLGGVAPRSSSRTYTFAVDNPTSITFAEEAYAVSEGAGTVTLTVRLSQPAQEPTSVGYATSDGTATAGSDYTAASGTLTFAQGQTSASIQIALRDDDLDEPGETFYVTLDESSASGAFVGDPYVATVTIVDEVSVFIPVVIRP
ncbi:MAG TPA: Calx-beta domain-containing protein [bacterium]|nr:Calx-beta domain-containing protein [bacterium]HXF82199.1 Calx-beta domain-containing protein [bacterium]